MTDNASPLVRRGAKKTKKNLSDSMFGSTNHPIEDALLKLAQFDRIHLYYMTAH